MLIQEDYVEVRDDGKRYGNGESGFFEPYTDNIKDLFETYQKEYGRCTSKIYIDKPDGSVIIVGWVFQKRMKYTDCNETYIQESWITLHDDKPTKTVEYHYHELKG